MNNNAIGQKYLVTTNNWFLAPNGKQYKAAHGTVKGILSDNETLGIQTNRHSSNWYLEIGSLIIAGCQIHYAIKSDECNFNPIEESTLHDGEFKLSERPSNIYNADKLSGCDDE